MLTKQLSNDQKYSIIIVISVFFHSSNAHREPEVYHSLSHPVTHYKQFSDEPKKHVFDIWRGKNPKAQGEPTNSTHTRQRCVSKPHPVLFNSNYYPE